MEVIRKVKKEVKKIQLGDQIKLGRYTATAVAQDASGTTFCFDQVYGESPTKTPFDAKRMKALYKSTTMDPVREFMIPLCEDVINTSPAEFPLTFFRSPTAEEIFAKFRLRPISATAIPGADKRWEVMKNGSYLVSCDVSGNPRSYWTESLTKPESPAYRHEGANVVVYYHGGLGYTNLDNDENYIFWRPVFKLKV